MYTASASERALSTALSPCASADCILLDKDLLLLWEGVREWRQVFVNVLKHLRLGASSNFGTMLSMLGASCFLPHLPMTPLQILVNNLLYDSSSASCRCRQSHQPLHERVPAEGPTPLLRPDEPTRSLAGLHP